MLHTYIQFTMNIIFLNLCSLLNKWTKFFAITRYNFHHSHFQRLFTQCSDFSSHPQLFFDPTQVQIELKPYYNFTLIYLGWFVCGFLKIQVTCVTPGHRKVLITRCSLKSSFQNHLWIFRRLVCLIVYHCSQAGSRTWFHTGFN